MMIVKTFLRAWASEITAVTRRFDKEAVYNKLRLHLGACASLISQFTKN